MIKRRQLNKDRVYRHMARDVSDDYYYVYLVDRDILLDLNPRDAEVAIQKKLEKQHSLWLKLVDIRWPDKTVRTHSISEYDLDYYRYRIKTYSFVVED